MLSGDDAATLSVLAGAGHFEVVAPTTPAGGAALAALRGLLD